MRQQLIKDRGTIDPKTDAALTALEKLTGESDSLIPELNNTKDTLVKLNATTNSILDTLEESGADITEYQTLLKNIKTSLGNLENLMDDLDGFGVAVYRQPEEKYLRYAERSQGTAQRFR